MQQKYAVGIAIIDLPLLHHLFVVVFRGGFTIPSLFENHPKQNQLHGALLDLAPFPPFSRRRTQGT